MKKLLVSLLCVMMVFCMMPSMAFAETVSSGWPDGSVVDNKITVPDTAVDGHFSKQYQGESITGGKDYSIIVDLSKEYTHGELFVLSLGFQDQAGETGSYADEFMVETVKSGNDFILTAGYAADQSITISKPGIYTYNWHVEKAGAKTKVKFTVEEANGALEGELLLSEDANYFSYLWAFGRYTAEGYKLDRDLTLYTEDPSIAKIGNVGYASLQDAIAVAESGETITVVQDITVDASLTIPEGVELVVPSGKTLNVGEYLLKGKVIAQPGSTVAVTDDGTVKNIVGNDSMNVTAGAVEIAFVDLDNHMELTVPAGAVAEINGPFMDNNNNAYRIPKADKLVVNGTLNIPSDKKVEVAGDLNVNGTVTVNGTLELVALKNGSAHGSMEIAAGASVVVKNGATLTVADGCSITVDGKLYEEAGATITGVPAEKITKITPPSGGGIYVPPTADPLPAAKTEATNNVNNYVKPAKYEEAEAAEIKAIMDKAAADIKNAKTEEEVKAIEEAAKAEIDKIETAEEKAIIRTVEATKFKARSKATTLNGKKAIKVTWTVPEGMDFDGFEIYRSTEQYKGFGTKPIFTTTKQQYINNKGLEVGKTYYYKIRAFKYVNDEKVYTEYSYKAIRTVK